LKTAAERAYFIRDYDTALSILDQAKDWTLGPKELQELQVIREACLEKQQQQQQNR
jgi:hypothetical protein